MILPAAKDATIEAAIELDIEAAIVLDIEAAIELDIEAAIEFAIEFAIELAIEPVIELDIGLGIEPDEGCPLQLLDPPLPLLPPVPGPMAIAAVAAATVDLFAHFSMWPFRTSLRLNFLPQRGQG